MVKRAFRLISGIVSFVAPILLLLSPWIEPYPWADPQAALLFERAIFGIGILGLVTMFGFMWYTVRSQSVPPDKRALWVVVLFTANLVALPFFWYWYVGDGHPVPRASAV
jgi:hypothetical protein